MPEPRQVRDKWVIGEGLESPGRWYVLHTAAPRFIVEIVDEDEWVIGSGISWSLPEGQVACNAEFFDAPPAGAALDNLMLGLATVLEDYDERVERRTARDKRCLDDDEAQ